MKIRFLNHLKYKVGFDLILISFGKWWFTFVICGIGFNVYQVTIFNEDL